MTPAGLALNVLLAVLLLIALVFGWRLERRLRALKDSQAGFAKAVADLDAAAQRAEQGLADLRAATDEAAETLAGRIDMAKALVARLDGSMARSERQPPSSRSATPLSEPVEPAKRAVRSIAAPQIAPMETPRSRARIDDDLFDEPQPPARPAPFGGRR